MLKKINFQNKIRIEKFNLNTILLGSFSLAILSTFFYMFFIFSISNLIISFSSALFILCLLYLNRVDHNYLLVKRALIIYLDFILLPLAWLTTYGSKGPMVFYSIIFIIIGSLLLTNFIENVFLFLVVIQISLLWFFEPSLTSLIIFLSGNYNVEENLLLHYSLASMILCIIMIYNSRNTRNVEAILNEFSMIDPLTKLFNRRYLFENLKTIHDESIRTSKKYIVIIIDIDNFKKINDIYGHDIGDRILELMGNIIKNNIRSYDIGVRYGGDEFVIVLNNADTKYKDGFINRIKNEFNTYSIGDKDIQLDFSYGFSDVSSLSVEETLREADLNMYKNKNSKKKS